MAKRWLVLGLAVGLIFLAAGAWWAPLRAQDNDSADDDVSPADDDISPADDDASPDDDTSSDDQATPDDDATIDAGRSSVLGDSGCGC